MAFKKEIDWELVELYIKAGSTQVNIANRFCIDRDTLRDRVKEKYGMDYSAFSAALISEGEMLIEAKQFDKAMKGCWPALHWLGKIRCRQKEPENTTTVAINQTQLDQTHRIMQLEHELQELKNENK
jgi:hypothetical protein